MSVLVQRNSFRFRYLKYRFISVKDNEGFEILKTKTAMFAIVHVSLKALDWGGSHQNFVDNRFKSNYHGIVTRQNSMNSIELDGESQDRRFHDEIKEAVEISPTGLNILSGPIHLNTSCREWKVVESGVR